MGTTPGSLLDRLKAASPESADWHRLHDMYLPLVRQTVARAGLTAAADDLAQEVMVAVFRNLPRFERRRDGSFRTWLRTITINKIRSHVRAARPEVSAPDGYLERLADPASGPAAEWDREHDRRVFDRLLAAVRPDFAAATWEAFRLFAVEGRPAADAAAATGLTENAVFVAKARVLRRLREEAAGLIE